jgi:hypothetical protein
MPGRSTSYARVRPVWRAGAFVTMGGMPPIPRPRAPGRSATRLATFKRANFLGFVGCWDLDKKNNVIIILIQKGNPHDPIHDPR